MDFFRITPKKWYLFSVAKAVKIKTGKIFWYLFKEKYMMRDKEYNQIKQLVESGMSVRSACGRNDNLRKRFENERKRRNDTVIKKAGGLGKCEPVVVNQETLNLMESLLFSAILERLKKNDISVLKLSLELLKARHPSYKEANKSMFTPEDYRKVWEDLRAGKKNEQNEQNN